MFEYFLKKSEKRILEEVMKYIFFLTSSLAMFRCLFRKGFYRLICTVLFLQKLFMLTVLRYFYAILSVLDKHLYDYSLIPLAIFASLDDISNNFGGFSKFL